MKPILSLRDLSSRLGFTLERLRELADEIGGQYHTFEQWNEKKQKSRKITAPSRELKELQRRINNLFRDYGLLDSVHGSVKGRSPLSNAAQHLGQPCLINLDVKSFYPSIRHYMVHRLLRHELGFGRDVARLLTRLVTLDASLPQGAPTSGTIANVLLDRPLDRPIAALAQRQRVRATRFLDDVGMSGANPRQLINQVGQCLSRRRLKIWRKGKLKIMPNHQRQEVTGLVVNSRSGPTVSRQYRDGVRAAVYQLRVATDGNAFRGAVNSIGGKITYIRQFNPGAAKRLQSYLDIQLGVRAVTAATR